MASEPAESVPASAYHVMKRKLRIGYPLQRLRKMQKPLRQR